MDPYHIRQPAALHRDNNYFLVVVLVAYHTPAGHCIPAHRCNYLVGHMDCLIVRRGCSYHSPGRPVGRSLDLDCTGMHVSSHSGMVLSRSISIDVF